MTSVYEEGLGLLDEKFGNGKGNLISLVTITRESGTNGKPRLAVCCMDTYCEDCTFYITAYGRSNRMLQIEQNVEVAVALPSETLTAMGVGKSLGRAPDPQNAEIGTKLHTAFASWHDMVNNEKDENCHILAIHLTRGTLNINH